MAIRHDYLLSLTNRLVTSTHAIIQRRVPKGTSFVRTLANSVERHNRRSFSESARCPFLHFNTNTFFQINMSDFKYLTKITHMTRSPQHHVQSHESSPANICRHNLTSCHVTLLVSSILNKYIYIK